MLKRFVFEIASQEMDLTQERTLLAVSGGVDSMVMLHLFQKAQLPIAVLHCNFGLRGDESDADEAFVKDTCLNLGVDFKVKRVDLSNFTGSTQMKARSARYKWFEEERMSNHVSFIATAHHQTDDVETFFLNMLRGSGIKGLVGIAQKRNHVIRPLLTFSKKEILQYAQQEGVPFREDSSNKSLSYKRNKIRHLLLPGLREIEPQFESRFSVTKDILKQEQAFLTHQLNHICSEVFRDGRVWEDELLQNEHYPLLIQHHFGGLGFNQEQISTLTEWIKGEKTSGKSLFASDFRIDVSGDKLFWGPITGNVNTIEEVQFGSYSFGEYHIEISKEPIPDTTEIVSFEEITLPLTIRNWQDGDSFKPLGMKGLNKKLSDFFIDLKIPHHERNQIPIFVDATGEIIYIGGLRISELIKTASETRVSTYIKCSKGLANSGQN